MRPDKRILLTLAALVSLFLAVSGAYLFDHRPLHRIPSEIEFHGKNISFFAIGDQGSGDSEQRHVANAMEQVAEKRRQLDMVLLLGDNFYSKSPRNADSREWMSKFERVYDGERLADVPFYAILGNHDHGKSGEAQLDYAKKEMGSNRWRMPGRYYSRDFGQMDGRPLLRIVFLDTNMDAAGLGKQADFIVQKFTRQPSQPIWRMVVGHHPLRTFGRHYGETGVVEASLMPALKKCHVDFYLSGHDHNLQVISKNDEPIFVVSGGGGGEAYPITRQSPDMRFAKSTHGFMELAMNDSSATLVVHDVSGGSLASYRLDRQCGYGRPDCLVPQ